MNRNVFLALLRATLTLGLILAASAVCAQTTFVINTLGDNPDNDPGDGDCSTGAFAVDPPPVIEECTLRAALEEANATSGPVTIEIDQFIERTVGVLSIIDIESALPFISNQITIAGETHPNWEHEGATHLVLRGPGSSTFSGLRFSSGAAGSTVRSIGIQGFGGNGILIAGGDNYRIESNVLGGAWGVTTYSYPGNGRIGLVISNSSSNQVIDNMIVSNDSHGILIEDGSASNLVQGNVIGLSRSGGTIGPFKPENGNGSQGIVVRSSAGPGNAIGYLSGNTIANNGASGILILADGQLVLGNRIGMPHNGNVASGFESSDYGNGHHGISISGSDNVIGTGGAGRNVIGHSGNSGIDLADNASNNEITWNWIGTNPEGEDLGMTRGIALNASGNNLISNNNVAYGSMGIQVSAGDSTIVRNTITNNNTGVRFEAPGRLGSSNFSDANVIGGNGDGVMVWDYAGGDFVSITNNYIGTDADGASLGNTAGVTVYGAGSTVRIGQPGGAGNVIVNSESFGINLRLEASDVTVAGNLIGIHPNGQPMGNHIGISIGSGALKTVDNRIGYALDDTINPQVWSPGNDAANVIAHNDNGIYLAGATDDSTGNIIRGNSIYSNGPAIARGIDLGMENLDVGGAASGPNNLMNYPDFDMAATQYDAATTEIDYRVRVQTTPANADWPLIIDFFLTDGNSPQGKTFIGSLEYPETAAFEFRTGTIALPQNAPAGSWLVATATDSSGNTSQFTNEPVQLGLPESIFSDRFEAP